MRLLAGKHGASKTPTPIRVSTSPGSPCTSPISAVNADHSVSASE